MVVSKQLAGSSGCVCLHTRGAGFDAQHVLYFFFTFCEVQTVVMHKWYKKLTSNISLMFCTYTIIYVWHDDKC